MEYLYLIIIQLITGTTPSAPWSSLSWQDTCLTDCEGEVVGTGKAEMRVLLVEDGKLLSWSLVRSLTKWGFDVQSVFTGKDALDWVKKSEFEIVLLDYQLPDMDGLTVAKDVRKIRPDSAIFLVTAFQLSELSIDAGLIDDYFNKPVDLQRLRESLCSILKERQGA